MRDFPSLTTTLHNEDQGSSDGNGGLEIDDDDDNSNSDNEQTDEKDADELYVTLAREVARSVCCVVTKFSVGFR